jgi:hypothetical protein
LFTVFEERSTSMLVTSLYPYNRLQHNYSPNPSFHSLHILALFTEFGRSTEKEIGQRRTPAGRGLGWCG